MASHDVTPLQIALNAQGAVLTVDGIFGTATQAAMRGFEANHSLPVTDQPSRAVCAALGITLGPDFPYQPIALPPKPFRLDLSTILAFLPLLKGTPMTADQVTGIIRAILTAVGGYFVARGTIDQGTATAIVGAAVTIAAAVWSLWSNRPKTIVPLSAK